MRGAGWPAATALLYGLVACGIAVHFRRLDATLRRLSLASAALGFSGVSSALSYWIADEGLRINLARLSFFFALAGLVLVVINAIRFSR
jgi:hypothetical protein